MKVKLSIIYTILILVISAYLMQYIILSTAHESSTIDFNQKWLRNFNQMVMTVDYLIHQLNDQLPLHYYNHPLHEHGYVTNDYLTNTSQNSTRRISMRKPFVSECTIRSQAHLSQSCNITVSGNCERVLDLPDFNYDYTEYIYGSIIERVSDSWSLYVDTFMMTHDTIRRTSYTHPRYNPLSYMREDMIPYWLKLARNFNKTYNHYYSTGERKQPPYMYCRLTHHNQATSYSVKGKFIPTKLSLDSVSNQRVDIFRCPMKFTREAYMTLANTNATMLVEILKESKIIGKFHISWLTRRVGFMMQDHSNSIESDTIRPYGIRTKFDPWKGFDRNNPGKWTHDTFYLVVPEIDFIPQPRVLGQVVEFIQHHINIGTQHIFLSIPYGRSTTAMYILSSILQSYIDEGLVTLTSSSNDGYDGVRGLSGLKLERDLVKYLYLNMIIYLSKGVSYYVGVWDIDEFLIPQGLHRTVQTMLKAIESPNTLLPSPLHTSPLSSSSSSSNIKNSMKYNHIYNSTQKWVGGRGWADQDAHPSCGHILQSRMLKAHPTIRFDNDLIWIGERYPHFVYPFDGKGFAFHKSIRDTRKAYYGGLHLSSTCALPVEWTPCISYPKNQERYNCTSGYCDGMLCYGDGYERRQLDRLTISNNKSNYKYEQFINHRIDEAMHIRDFKFVNHDLEGVIYHIALFRESYTVKNDELKTYWNLSDATNIYTTNNRNQISKNSPLKYASRNDYIALYYPHVMRELDRRKLRSLLELPTVLKYPIYIIDKTYMIEKRNDRGLQLHRYSVDMNQASKQRIQLPIWSSIDDYIYMTSILILPSASNIKGHIHTTNTIHPNIIIYRTHEKYKDNIWRNATIHERDHIIYKCHITLSSSPSQSAAYTVDASIEWGEILDVLRCSLQGIDAHNRLQSDVLSISIYNNNYQNIPVLSYTLSWNHHRINCALWQPEMISTSTSTFSSPSLNNNISHDKYNHNLEKNKDSIKIVSFVPGTVYYPSRQTISYYIEYIQHMVNLGISHIYICVYFSVDSIHMKHLVSAVSIYLNQGLLTIISMNFEKTVFMVPSIRKQFFLKLKNDNINMLELLMINIGSINSYMLGADHLIITQLNDLIIPTQSFERLDKWIKSLNLYKDMTVPLSLQKLKSDPLFLSCHIYMQYQDIYIPKYIDESSNWLYEKLMYHDIMTYKDTGSISNMTESLYLVPILNLQTDEILLLYEQYPLKKSICNIQNLLSSTHIQQSSLHSSMNSFQKKEIYAMRLLTSTTPSSSSSSTTTLKKKLKSSYIHTQITNNSINKTFIYNDYTQYYSYDIYNALNQNKLNTISLPRVMKNFDCIQKKNEIWLKFYDLYFNSNRFK